MRYLFDHTILMDHDLWHLLAVAAFLLVLAIVWKKISTLKKEQEELEHKVSGLNSADVAEKADLSFMDDFSEQIPAEKTT